MKTYKEILKELENESNYGPPSIHAIAKIVDDEVDAMVAEKKNESKDENDSLGWITARAWASVAGALCSHYSNAVQRIAQLEFYAKQS
ncbi:hypothetical protein AMJ86_00740 [bacterium SM23_57]|nr:MAG: hypothetical protein AMJ86_00740 [bacterium SM23_57]